MKKILLKHIVNIHYFLQQVRALNIPINQDPNKLLDDVGIDDLTNKITIPNSHKIVIAGGSASMLELYYGYIE